MFRPTAWAARTGKGSNVKANRNCLNLADADLTGRSQANNETSVAIDPATGDLVMGDNDYRRGDSGCCGRLQPQRRADLVRQRGADRLHPRRRLRGGPRVLAGGRRPRGRRRHPRQLLLLLPAVQPGPADHPGGRRLQRHLPVPLHRQRRRVLELPGPGGGREPRHRRHQRRARGQGAAGGRQPPRQPLPRPRSTSPGPSSRPTGPPTSGRGPRPTTASPSAPGAGLGASPACTNTFEPAHPERPLQREPVLPAVRRPRRRPVRRLVELQQRRRAARPRGRPAGRPATPGRPGAGGAGRGRGRERLPGPAGPSDRRRSQLRCAR
jgi:hypothetical protein